jgi:hypothetical protein
MTTPIPPSLDRFGDELNRAAYRELSTRSAAVRARVARPRFLAGGSLGLAGIGAALVLAFSGSTAAPAFAVTRQDDGSVLVQLNYVTGQNLPQVDQKLAAMGVNEEISVRMAPGAASANGAVACTPAPGVSGPTVKVIVGSNGTEVIAPGQSAGNTAEGSFHMISCSAYPAGNNG